MKYLVALLLLFVLIAEYEQRRIKIKLKYKNGKWKIKVRHGWFKRGTDDLRAARNDDYIDEGDLDKRETAILTTGLQSLLQHIYERREKADIDKRDTDDTEYV